MFPRCLDLLSIPFGFRHNPGFAEHSTTQGSPNRSVDRSVGYYSGGKFSRQTLVITTALFSNTTTFVCERSLLSVPKGNSCDLCLFTCVPRTHEAPHSSANCSGLPRKSAFGGNYLEFGTKRAEEREREGEREETGSPFLSIKCAACSNNCLQQEIKIVLGLLLQLPLQTCLIKLSDSSSTLSIFYRAPLKGCCLQKFQNIINMRLSRNFYEFKLAGSLSRRRKIYFKCS